MIFFSLFRLCCEKIIEARQMINSPIENAVIKTGAIIGKEAVIGKNVVIQPNVTVHVGATFNQALVNPIIWLGTITNKLPLKFGDTIADGSVILSGTIIKDGITIQSGVKIESGVSVEKQVFVPIELQDKVKTIVPEDKKENTMETVSIQKNNPQIINPSFSFPANYIVPSNSQILSGVIIPNGVVVSNGTKIYSNAIIKSGAIIQSGVEIEPGVEIESGAKIYTVLPNGTIWSGDINIDLPVKTKDFIKAGSIINSIYLPDGIYIHNSVNLPDGIFIGHKKAIKKIVVNSYSDNNYANEILVTNILPNTILLPGSIIKCDVILPVTVGIMNGVIAEVGAKLPVNRGKVKWIGEINSESFLQNGDEIISQDKKSIINCAVNKNIEIQKNVYVSEKAILSANVVLRNLVILDASAQINCNIPRLVQWIGKDIKKTIGSGSFVLENSSISGNLLNGANIKSNVNILKNSIVNPDVNILGPIYLDGSVGKVFSNFPITYYGDIKCNQLIKSGDIVTNYNNEQTTIYAGVILQKGAIVEKGVKINEGVNMEPGVIIDTDTTIDSYIPSGILWTGEILSQNLNRMKPGDTIIASAVVTPGTQQNNYEIKDFISESTELKSGDVVAAGSFILSDVVLEKGIKISKGVLLCKNVQFQSPVSFLAMAGNTQKQFNNIVLLRLIKELFVVVEESFTT